ncbi:hypothetical protein V5O48_010049 [Marasmius crinis-equi]|uniref:MYND-type domain-containing protein n=1 Tax=Marasmius crinis-equi TaxID=585013 RepID=A0ABR3F9D4_9AGAR
MANQVNGTVPSWVPTPPLAAIAPTTPSQIAGLVCSGCFKPPAQDKKLDVCSGCLRVFYCGVECQKTDWKLLHRYLCPALQRVNGYDQRIGRYNDIRPEDYEMDQFKRGEVYSQPTEKDPYGTMPREWIRYQSKCEVCFRTRFMSKTPHIPLNPCPDCRLSWWCNSSTCEKKFPKAHNEEACRAHSDAGAIDRVKIDWAIHCKSRVQLVICSEVLRKKYIPISSVNDWADYHRRVFPDFDAYSDYMSRDFKTYHPTPLKAVRMLAMEATVLPLTVLEALEDIYGTEAVGKRTKLCVHVVGAASREMTAKSMLEELLHQLPKLKTVEAVFVGPEVQIPPPGIYEPPNLACPSCIRDGRQRIYSYENILYHDYVRSSKAKARTTPDIIVALNTGMSEMEMDSWKKTMKVILDKNVPGVFTCYSKLEGEMEVDMLTKMGAKFTKPLAQNRWRGVIPNLHVYLSESQADPSKPEASGPLIFWNSNYRYIIQGRK